MTVFLASLVGIPPLGGWFAKFGISKVLIESHSKWGYALAFVVAGSRWAQADGQIMYILVISLAAAEASIGLALLLLLYRRYHTLNVDTVSEMRG